MSKKEETIMKVYAIDWATRKDLAIYDGKKIKKIANTISEFDKFLESIKGGGATIIVPKVGARPGLPAPILLFEFGGADSYKIMAYRAGFQVLQVPGKKVHDYRESLGIEKTDENDAKLIYDFYMKERGSAMIIMPQSAKVKLPLPENKRGGGAICKMSKKIVLSLPAPFSIFTEQSADIAEIKILFRRHEDLKKVMVREKNKKFALQKQYEITNIGKKTVKKLLSHSDYSIAGKEKEIAEIKKILKSKVSKFRVWNNYLKDIKGVGEFIASGLIGELGGRQFDSDDSLKHYAGMVKKSAHSDYNHYIKVVLFQFAEGIIKARTPIWRELYDNMKVFYQKKHEDWSKGKVNNYAKKFIETKFLCEFWKQWKLGEN